MKESTDILEKVLTKHASRNDKLTGVGFEEAILSLGAVMSRAMIRSVCVLTFFWSHLLFYFHTFLIFAFFLPIFLFLPFLGTFVRYNSIDVGGNGNVAVDSVIHLVEGTYGRKDKGKDR